MSYFDAILIILVGWAAISGVRKGFVMQLFGILALFLGIYCAFKLSAAFASLIHKLLPVDEQSLSILVFIIILIFVWVIILSAGKLLEKILKIAALGFINRLFGLLFSIIKAGFITGAIVLAISYLNIGKYKPIKDDLAKSKLYTPLKQVTHAAFPYIIYQKESDNL